MPHVTAVAEGEVTGLGTFERGYSSYQHHLRSIFDVCIFIRARSVDGGKVP